MSLREVAAALHITYGNARTIMKRIADGEKVRRGFPRPVRKLGAGGWLFDTRDVNRFIKDHGVIGQAH